MTPIFNNIREDAQSIVFASGLNYDHFIGVEGVPGVRGFTVKSPESTPNSRSGVTTNVQVVRVTEGESYVWLNATPLPELFKGNPSLKFYLFNSAQELMDWATEPLTK